MANTFTKNSLALVAAAMMGCVSSSSQTVKQEPASLSCESLDLGEKVGFSTVLNPNAEEADKVCYKIISDGNNFTEYLATCKPVLRNIECYRNFAGPEKGEMRLDYTPDFLGAAAYMHFWRSSSGTISGQEEILRKNANKIKKGFETCERLLEMTLKVPKVCKELQEYKKK